MWQAPEFLARRVREPFGANASHFRDKRPASRTIGRRLDWLSCVLGAVLLAGCATESSVVMPEALRTAMRQKATTVLFTDDVGAIRFIWGRFNAPDITRPIEWVRYDDQWDAGPAVAAVHADELAKLGFQAKSIYAILGDSKVSSLTAPGRENRGKNYEITPVLTPELASALQSQGQQYLIWVTWSGLEYFHTILPFQPVEQINSSYWVFDLNTRALIWSGGLADIRDSGFKYAEATRQLEADQFAGLRRLVVERYRMAYRREDDTVPWLLGLLNPK